MNVATEALSVILAVTCLACAAAADVLVLDEFATLDTSTWLPFNAYPEDCVPATENGRSVLGLGYSGANCGIRCATIPVRAGGSMCVSVTFKPVGDPNIVLLIRLADAVNPTAYFYVDTRFWGTGANFNMIGIYDRKNRVNYYSPTKLWIPSPSPGNWLTDEFAIGPTNSVATVRDFRGEALWQSGSITSAGTNNLPNGLSLILTADYTFEDNSPVELYIDQVLVTDDHTGGSDTIAWAKSLLDGEPVSCTGIVTGIFEDGFYIETADRTSGIRVLHRDPKRTVGEAVEVIGTIDTPETGERFILASVVR